LKRGGFGWTRPLRQQAPYTKRSGARPDRFSFGRTVAQRQRAMQTALTAWGASARQHPHRYV